MHVTRMLVLMTVISILTAPAAAQPEPVAVYEDWRGSSTLRSDRWGGTADSAQEIRRELQGNRLLMRLRKEGATTSDSDFTSAQLRLSLVNPADVTHLETDLKVRDLTVTTCAANATFPSRLRAATVSINKFNDGSSMEPGDLTGDHFGRIQLNRDGNSPDPDGVMRVEAFVFRCVNRNCSSALSVGPPVFFPDTVRVGDALTLRVRWERDNHRFLAGIGTGPDVALPYPPGADVRPAGLPFAQVTLFNIPASCSAGATVTDAQIWVEEVRTNASAVIP